MGSWLIEKIEKNGVRFCIEYDPLHVIPEAYRYRSSDPAGRIPRRRVIILGDTIYLFAGSHEEFERFVSDIESAETINNIESVLKSIIENDPYYKSEFSSSIEKENDIERVSLLCELFQ